MFIMFMFNVHNKLLSNLTPFKATGPDDLPPFILKEFAYELASPFYTSV